MRTLLLILMLLSVVACDGAMGGKKKVLVIESYSRDFGWDAAYEKGIVDRLGDGYEVSYFYMDAKRLPREEHPQMAAKAVELVRSTKPDVVVIGDDTALKFTAPRLAREDVPVVFLGINNNPRNYFDSWPENFTGVMERPLLHSSIATLNSVMPNARKIAVLFDDDLTSKLVKMELFAGKDSINIGGTDVDLHLFETYQQWQAFIAESGSKYDAYVVGLYHTLKDGSGAVAPPNDVLAWTSKNSALPLFCFWDFSIGPDLAIGGQIVSGEEQGQMAADIVKKIMGGAKPVEIAPVTGGNGKLMFSTAQLTKHGLSLPATLADTALLVD